MSLDEAEDKIHGIKVGANGQGILGLSPTVLASITQAKSAKILHGFVASDEVSFTYDISLFARARNIALTLCSAN